MFGEFIKRLTQPEPDELGDTGARLALSALLVRIARTDGDYAESEIARIDRILVARYELSAFDAVALRRQAETLESEAPDTVRFTKAIKRSVPLEERRGVVEALWQVALADGDRGQEENSLLRLLANLLGVSDMDSNTIRRRVEKTGN